MHNKLVITIICRRKKRHCGLVLTSTRLLICGMSRSIRTSTSITNARQTFLRTSESSSVDRKNKFCKRTTHNRTMVH